MRHASEQLPARPQGPVVDPDAEFGSPLGHTYELRAPVVPHNLALSACHAEAFSVGGLNVEHANGKPRSHRAYPDRDSQSRTTTIRLVHGAGALPSRARILFL